MVSLGGGIFYKAVVPPSEDRDTFDGSVPYAVLCSGVADFVNSSGSSASKEIVLSLIGQPSADVVTYDSAPSHVGIQKSVSVNLRDMWICVNGSDTTLRYTITVCDPASFPTSAEHVYLEEGLCSCSSSNAMIKIPDIKNLTLVGSSEQPLNVCLKLFTANGANSSVHLTYHFVSVVDD